jgi:F-type H+-transporting ATPase subunit a
VSVVSRLVANEGGNGFHPPSIDDFYPHALFGDGTFYEFNRILMVRVIAAALLMLIFVLIARNAKVIPSRAQSVVEIVLDGVRSTVIHGVLGEKEGKRFENLLLTIFLAIFAFNITGVIPGLNIASTGLIGMPLLLAVVVWVVYLASGVRKHGPGGYVKHSLFPPGVPLVLKPLIAAIDALQAIILRPATLALRLTINMVVGHLLLVLTIEATQYFWVTAASNFNIVYGVLTFVGIVFITCLEIFVAGLQAYIFIMLSAVYINMAVSEDH